MKVEGGGYYLREVNDGARTVCTRGIYHFSATVSYKWFTDFKMSQQLRTES